jgi:hypothetical protein
LLRAKKSRQMGKTSCAPSQCPTRCADGLDGRAASVQPAVDLQKMYFSTCAWTRCCEGLRAAIVATWSFTLGLPRHCCKLQTAAMSAAHKVRSHVCCWLGNLYDAERERRALAAEADLLDDAPSFPTEHQSIWKPLAMCWNRLGSICTNTILYLGDRWFFRKPWPTSLRTVVAICAGTRDMRSCAIHSDSTRRRDRRSHRCSQRMSVGASLSRVAAARRDVNLARWRCVRNGRRAWLWEQRMPWIAGAARTCSSFLQWLWGNECEDTVRERVGFRCREEVETPRGVAFPSRPLCRKLRIRSCIDPSTHAKIARARSCRERILCGPARCSDVEDAAWPTLPSLYRDRSCFSEFDVRVTLGFRVLVGMRSIVQRRTSVVATKTYLTSCDDSEKKARGVCDMVQ